jgi:hypothetical protein
VAAEAGDGGVERREGPGGAGLHDGALHHGEHEVGEVRGRGVAGQAVAGLLQPPGDDGAPQGEVALDEGARRGMAVAHLEGEVADGAAHAAGGALELGPVEGEEGEDAGDGVGLGALDGAGHEGLEEGVVVREHALEQGLLGGEEVVEAAGVGVRLAEDGGDAGGGVALLVEEAAGGLEDARAGAGVVLHRELNGRSSAAPAQGDSAGGGSSGAAPIGRGYPVASPRERMGSWWTPRSSKPV